MILGLARTAQAAARTFDRLIAPGRWWALRVGVLAVVASALHAVPPYEVRFMSEPVATIAKGLHPLTHFGSRLSHEANLDYRFVVPLLLRPFGSFVVAAILFAVCGVVAYMVLAKQMAACGVAPRTIALALVGLAVTPAGSVFLLGLDYFDAVAIALVLIALWLRNPFGAAAVAFAAAYTDERALIGLVVGVTGAAWLAPTASKLAPRRGITATTLAVVVAVYAATRVVLDVTTNLRTEPTDIGPGYIASHLHRWPLGLVTAFAFWWIVVGVGLRVAVRRQNSIAVITVTILTVISAIAVADVTRSLAYLLPIVPVVVVGLSTQWERADVERLLLVALAASALTPAFVMNGPLAHELPLLIHVARWLGFT